MDKRKYKLLVADDEYWTREKLRRMISWDLYNIEFLEPVENGEEVLEQLKKEVPDILITDINMPIINGVDLMKVTKEKYPDIISFVVSGYDDFEYVKSTLKSGAINYLLKPVTKVDLIQSVSEAMDIINHREEQKLQNEQIRAEQLRNTSMLQDREFSRLIDKTDSMKQPDLSININLDSAGYCFVLIKVHDMKTAMNHYNQNINQLSYDVKKKLKGILIEDNVIIFNHITKSNEFIIIFRKDNSSSQEKVDEYIQWMEKMFVSPITVIINKYTFSMEHIHNAYTQAVSLLMTRDYNKSSQIVIHDTKSNQLQKEKRTEVLSNDLINQLQVFLKAGNGKRVEESIYHNLKSHVGNQSTFLDIKQMVRQMNNLLMGYMSKDIDPAENIHLEHLLEEVDRSVESLDLDLVLKKEKILIQTIMSNQVMEETETMEETVKQVQSYIHQHYYEELSLSILSERFLVEFSYLSKCFKQYTGENLTTYISRIKIEKSISYIEENNLSLSEISFLVGYDDYTYFSRVFKKVKGVSPRDYRNQMVKDDMGGAGKFES